MGERLKDEVAVATGPDSGTGQATAIAYAGDAPRSRWTEDCPAVRDRGRER